MWQIVITLLMPHQHAINTVLERPRFQTRGECVHYVESVMLKDTDMTDVSVACLKERK